MSNSKLPSKYNDLFEKALEIRKNATAIYSKFKVGAVIKTKQGKLYGGSNIESASYGLSICAERVALFKALSEGEREFDEIIVLADFDNQEEICRPCGACRQLLLDYACEIKVIMTNIMKTNYEEDSITNLLKDGFKI